MLVRPLFVVPRISLISNTAQVYPQRISMKTSLRFTEGQISHGFQDTVRVNKEKLFLDSLKILAENRTTSTVRIRTNDIIFFPERHVSYYLFVRNVSKYEVLKLGDRSSIINSRFNKSKPTKILVHGWLSSGLYGYSVIMKDAYLEVEDLNIINVDWPSFRLYTLARLAVRPVAKVLANFLDFLIGTVGVKKDSIHVLGHSLGAHIAGIAGQYTRYHPLPRITGFDPAGPLFMNDKDGRLDSSDAEFVDVIHTSGGFLGYFDPVGHLDFYPNGGVAIQPGCGFDLGTCSHGRSYEYYIASLSDTESPFYAVPCDSFDDFRSGRCCSQVIEMGPNVNITARGKYYLYTNSTSPYGLGRNGIVDHCWAVQ